MRVTSSIARTTLSQYRWLAGLLLILMPFCYGYALELKQLQVKQGLFDVVTLDTHKETVQLLWKHPQTQLAFTHFNAVAAYARENHKTLRFAANAGIYAADNTPLGLHIEGGKILRKLNRGGDSGLGGGNFSLKPNGVFLVSATGQAQVMTTEDYVQWQDRSPLPQFATQSGPMLLIDGQLHPRFIMDSPSLKLRSGVCAQTPTRLHFVISRSVVNFYDFAHVFLDHLDCKNALYLDGTLSQFYVDGRLYGASFWQVRPYVGILAVFEG